MSIPTVDSTSKATQDQGASDNAKTINQVLRDFGMSSINKMPSVTVSTVKPSDDKDKK